MTAKLDRLKSQYTEKLDKIVEKAQDNASKLFEAIVQEQLNEWGKRFHNHSFDAVEGMGSLSFKMHPPFKNSGHGLLAGHFDYIASSHNRGAVAEMLKEAEAIQDLYAEERKIFGGFYTDNTLFNKF